MTQWSTYESAVADLAKRGIRAFLQNPDQLVITRQSGSVWPSGSNSFWISRRNSRWYLCTWLNICYVVPAGADMTDLCERLINSGDQAMQRAPEEYVQRLGLAELTDEKVEEMFGPFDE